MSGQEKQCEERGNDNFYYCNLRQQGNVRNLETTISILGTTQESERHRDDTAIIAMSPKGHRGNLGGCGGREEDNTNIVQRAQRRGSDGGGEEAMVTVR